ncbi:hypothetical protein [Modestobacter sp. VKM Ac-2984]|uniref:hypothetical protein n=1 Tax=Modestobacter sp. VKM Ac-2984 TaxID=3004138 RepID=UPI0022AA9E86|nr:hypothetical protein [Modestobacter sp. VKM Ac-2984]MCZ2818014.1 hypothetical protein [Modestobacter sp. VKM Ac-2984]
MEQLLESFTDRASSDLSLDLATCPVLDAATFERAAPTALDLPPVGQPWSGGLMGDLASSIGRLTGHPAWSLRLEGLEVGRIRPGRGWLDVGRVGRTGKESEARQVWRAAVGEAAAGTRLTVTTDDDGSVDHASTTLSAFAQSWLREPVSDGEVRQNEHALESRILRGACPVQASTGALDLLCPDHGMTSWGSQFPTRWGLPRATPPATSTVQRPHRRTRSLWPPSWSSSMQRVLASEQAA